MSFANVLGVNPCCCGGGGGGPPTTPCNGCNIPQALTLTWNYRSVPDPIPDCFAASNCPPSAGGANATLVFTLSYLTGTSRWVTGWQAVAGHEYCCFSVAINQGLSNPWITTGYSIRFAFTCLGNGQMELQSQIAETPPDDNPSSFAASPGSISASFANCSPFSWGASFYTGPPTPTAGQYYDEYIIS